MSQEIQTAIIAASFAILGAVISQAMTWLLSHLEKKRQKNILLRQKFEEMTFYFSDSLGWVSKVVSCTNEETLRELAHNQEARKALSLCQLYFLEELAHAANDYLSAQQSYYPEIVKVYDKNDQLNKTAGGQALSKNQDKYNKAKDNLYLVKDVFENLIISKSNKYTIA